MPYIGRALKIALPYVEQMIITLSVKSDEETIQEVFNIRSPKVEIYWEDVAKKAELTRIENEQIEHSKGEWIWTLEDDELWAKEDLEGVFSYMNEDIDAISVNQYQMIDLNHYDYGFRRKYLTKFFKREGAYWKKDFPKNVPYKDGKILYHKKNERNKVVQEHFFHLPLLKENSFRDEKEWAKKYSYKVGEAVALSESYSKKLAFLLQ